MPNNELSEIKDIIKQSILLMFYSGDYDHIKIKAFKQILKSKFPQAKLDEIIAENENVLKIDKPIGT